MISLNYKSNLKVLALSAVFAMGSMITTEQAFCAGKKGQEKEPDYTKGEKLQGHRSGKTNRNFWNLGPIGAFGYIWANKEGTEGTRMIQVKEVVKESRADGVLQVGDVILGIGNKKFSSNARKALAEAISEAEKKENDGKLTLFIWRAGNEQSVDLKIPIMGSYSSTSPWDCAKSKAIIDNACDFLVNQGFFQVTRAKERKPMGGIQTKLDALGLLATGEEKYLPIIKEYARAIGKPDVKLDIENLSSWQSSYTLIFLCEYYLATGDKYVLPAITEYSDKIALGRSGAGTWGHNMAKPSWNGGGLYGKAAGYGAMNQVSITCTIALELARKCGVKTKKINTAIKMSEDFLRWYVDKGSIPYGDHKPWHEHDNNGVCSQVTVMYDLLGDKDSASYFNRMTLASYNRREPGHTGHFFAWQWGALGASRGGKEAAQSFIANTRWFVELERRHNGSFVYQPQLNNRDHGKYSNWSTTGQRLMQLCLPRKKLCITGKGGFNTQPIVGPELEKVVDAAVFNPTDETSTKELLKALGNWSPKVRNQAAKALGQREENVVKDLIDMLDSDNRYARYGACNGLHFAGRKSPEAVEALVKKVLDPADMDLRYHAVNALKIPKVNPKEPDQLKNALGEASLKAAPALLKLAATHDPVNDPNRKLHNEIANLLFYKGGVQKHVGFFPNGAGLEKVDRALLIPAIKSILMNPNGGARSLVSRIYPKLTEQDLEQLWGDIYYATKNQAPSGVMFSGGVRTAGLKLMAKHGVEEGMDVGVDIVARQIGWGDWGRKLGGFPALKSYGPALGPYYPELKKALDAWSKMKNKDRQDKAKEFLKLLEDMKEMPAPKLISIKKYIEEK